MPTTEAVFENGVLKPYVVTDLKEHQHYEVNWEELVTDKDDFQVPPHLAHRVKVLPNGQRVIWFSGALATCLDDYPEDFDPVTAAVTEMSQEQKQLQESEWGEFFPVEM